MNTQGYRKYKEADGFYNPVNQSPEISYFGQLPTSLAKNLGKKLPFRDHLGLNAFEPYEPRPKRNGPSACAVFGTGKKAKKAKKAIKKPVDGKIKEKIERCLIEAKKLK